MAGLAIVWRNPRFVQPRRLWTPASIGAKRSVYLVAEPVAAVENTWRGLPNLEVIRGGIVTPELRRAAQAGA